MWKMIFGQRYDWKWWWFAYHVLILVRDMEGEMLKMALGIH